MKIDNLNKIRPLLVFKTGKNNTPEIYYFVQVIQRRKDNPEMEGSEYQRGSWFITSTKELDKHWPRIVKTCEDYNARAYISLTPRSLSKLCKKCLLEYTNRIITEDYNRIYDIPKKAALSDYTIQSRGIIDKPRWVVDIDDPEYYATINSIMNNITKVIDIIPTSSGGYHLLVEAFNPKKLQPFCEGSCELYGDYKLSSGEEFTLRLECNTILYSNLKTL